MAPTLLLCLADRDAVDGAVGCLAEIGYEPLAPENPYWEGRSVTAEDPDNRRVVLCDGGGIRGGAARAA